MKNVVLTMRVSYNHMHVISKGSLIKLVSKNLVFI